MSPAIKNEVREFYAALGKAITLWADIESALFEIFERGLHLTDSEEAAAAFYSQINFRAKLDMVDAVMAVRLPKDKRDEWARLLKRLKKKAKKRNALAHYHMVYQATKGEGPILQLVPTLKPDPNRPANRLPFILGTADITTTDMRVYGLEFVVMSNELRAFLKNVLQETPPK